MAGDAELDRIARDIEDLAVRVRIVENVASPMAAQLVTEFRDLQKKVERINEEGALATQGELRRLTDAKDRIAADVADLEVAVREIAADRRSLFRAVLLALVAAALSLAGGVILWAISR